MRNYTEGELLKFLREKAQRGSQADLSKALGFSRQFINDVIQGRRSVTRELARSMGFIENPRRFVRPSRRQAANEHLGD